MPKQKYTLHTHVIPERFTTKARIRISYRTGIAADYLISVRRVSSTITQAFPPVDGQPAKVVGLDIGCDGILVSRAGNSFH